MKQYNVRFVETCYWETVVVAESAEEAERLLRKGETDMGTMEYSEITSVEVIDNIECLVNQFKNYWNNLDSHTNKQVTFINWANTQWNNGTICLGVFRELINIDV